MAGDEGVERVVYLGGLGEDDPAKLSAHLASRHEVGQVLADGPLSRCFDAPVKVIRDGGRVLAVIDRGASTH